MPLQKIDRIALIKTSLNVFRTHGYHHTSMAHIAEACGLLKGSLYHYYSSKKALMLAVIEYLSDHYEKTVFSITQDQTKTGMQKLAYLVEQSEHIFLTHKGGCLMASIGLETVNVVPEFTEKIRRFFTVWMEAFTHIFVETYSLDSAKRLAEQSVAEMEGAVLLMQLFQDETYVHNAHARIIDRYQKQMP